jgi:hypothetical protein
VFFIAGVPGVVGATVLVSDEHFWAVTVPVDPGNVVEYHLCDLDGAACMPLGVGDASKAGSPIRVDHRSIPSGRLRVRVCVEATLDAPERSCGPFSRAGVAFRFAPTLEPASFVSLPPAFVEETIQLSPGDRLVVPLEVPVAPPFAAVLRMGLFAPSGGVRVELRSDDPNGPVLYENGCTRCAGERTWDVSAALGGGVQGKNIFATIEAIGATVAIGGADPAESSFPAPHLVLYPSRRFLPDSDGDGVPDDGDGSGAVGDLSCAEGEWLGCDDSCPTVANLRQGDGDADGLGDACDNCRRVPNPRVSPPPAGHRTTGGQIDDDLDGVGNRCDGDWTGAGQVVDMPDLQAMIQALGKPITSNDCPGEVEGTTGPCASYDLDEAGDFVNLGDLLHLLDWIGQRTDDQGCGSDDAGTLRCPLACEAGPGALACS